MLREAARPRSRYGLHSLQTVWVSPCSNSISALTMRPGPVGARLSPPKKLLVRCILLQSPGVAATWRTPHCAARAAPCSWRPSVAHTVAQWGPSRDIAAGDLSQGRHGPFCSTPTSHQSFFLHPPHLLLIIPLATRPTRRHRSDRTSVLVALPQRPARFRSAADSRSPPRVLVRVF